MACKVKLTEAFEREYDDILDYHVNELGSPQAARALADALDDARNLLAANPELSAVSAKPALQTLELREWLARSYVIVYRIDDDRLYFEHIFHQSQDFETLV